MKLRESEITKKDGDLTSSDYDFYDAKESQESSEDEAVYEIEEVDTPVIAPAVFVNPNSRPPVHLPNPAPAETATIITLTPLEEVTQSEHPVHEEERPQYPTLEEMPSASAPRASESPSPNKSAEETTNNSGSVGILSWFGSFFRSSTPQPKESEPAPSASSDIEVPSEDHTISSAPSSNAISRSSQPNSGAQNNSSATSQQSSVAPSSTRQQPQTSEAQLLQQQQQQQQNHYYFFFGPNADPSALPPQVRLLVDSALTQTSTAPCISHVSLQSTQNMATQASSTSVADTTTHSRPLQAIEPHNAGAIPPPPRPPPVDPALPQAPPPHMSSSNNIPTEPLTLAPPPPPTHMATDRPASAPAAPELSSAVIPTPAKPAPIITAAERKAAQLAAKEAEKAKKARDAWISSMTELVMACERLRPQQKQEAIQHWIEWYATDIPHALLLTEHYGYLLKAIPKQFDFVKNAIAFWEGSLFRQLPSELHISEVDVNLMRTRRCTAICFAEEKWFRRQQANEATEEIIQAERTAFLTASFTFCSNIVQQSKDQKRQQELQNQLGSVLDKIKQKAESEAPAVEYDE